MCAQYGCCSPIGGNAGVGKETVKVRAPNITPCPDGSLNPEPQQLLAHNAKVYLAARSAQKANEAIAELKNETGKEAIFLQLDLSDLHAVRRSAQEFLSYVPIYCLFLVESHQHNTCVFQERESTACPYQQRVSFSCSFLGYDNPFRRPSDVVTLEYSGVMVPSKDQVTAQQYDLQFGTNVIGKSSSDTHS